MFNESDRQSWRHSPKDIACDLGSTGARSEPGEYAHVSAKNKHDKSAHDYHSGPAIGASEQPLLLAGFNGGFKASAGAGGFEVDGQVLTPLTNGLASLVIDTAGAGYLGVWGQDVPPPGASIASVRQNLRPLVEGGQPSSQINAIPAWGATLGGGSFVARSALGEDPSGDLLYAASMSTVPVDLATALINAGAVRAMEIDITPEWVQWTPQRPRWGSAGGPDPWTEPSCRPVPDRLDP